MGNSTSEVTEDREALLSFKFSIAKPPVLRIHLPQLTSSIYRVPQVLGIRKPKYIVTHLQFHNPFMKHIETRKIRMCDLNFKRLILSCSHLEKMKLRSLRHMRSIRCLEFNSFDRSNLKVINLYLKNAKNVRKINVDFEKFMFTGKPDSKKTPQDADKSPSGSPNKRMELPDDMEKYVPVRRVTSLDEIKKNIPDNEKNQIGIKLNFFVYLKTLLVQNLKGIQPMMKSLADLKHLHNLYVNYKPNLRYPMPRKQYLPASIRRMNFEIHNGYFSKQEMTNFQSQLPRLTNLKFMRLNFRVVLFEINAFESAIKNPQRPENIEDIDIIFSKCKNFSDNQIAPFMDWVSSMSKAIRLRLEATDYENITDNGIAMLGYCLIRLTQLISLNLSIGKLPKATDGGFWSLMRGLTQSRLKVLALDVSKWNLGKDSFVSNVKSILENCTLLEAVALNCAGLVKLNDKAVSSLASALKKTRYIRDLSLNLGDCPELTNESLNKIASCVCYLEDNLIRVQLGFGNLHKINDKGLQSFVAYFKGNKLLKFLSLDFSRNINITKQGFDWLIEGLGQINNLTELGLDFSECPKIGKGSIKMTEYLGVIQHVDNLKASIAGFVYNLKPSTFYHTKKKVNTRSVMGNHKERDRTASYFK